MAEGARFEASGRLDHEDRGATSLSSEVARGGDAILRLEARSPAAAVGEARRGDFEAWIAPGLVGAGAPGLTWSGMSVWRGEDRRLSLDGALAVLGLPESAVSQGRADGRLTISGAPESADVSLTLSAEDGGGRAIEATLQASVDPKARALRLARFEADHPFGEVVADGEIGFAGEGRFDLALRADPEPLGLGGTLGRAELAGAVRLAGWRDVDWRLGARAAWAEGHGLREALGPNIDVDARGGLSGDRITLDEASGTAGALTLQGRGSWEARSDGLSLRAQARLDDGVVGPVAAAVPVTLILDVDGSIADPAVRAELDAPAIGLGGLALDALLVRAERLAGDVLTVEAEGATPAGPLAVSIEGPLDADAWSLAAVRAALGESVFTGEGVATFQGEGAPKFDLDGTLERPVGLLTERASLKLALAPQAGTMALESALANPFASFDELTAQARWGEALTAQARLRSPFADLSLDAVRDGSAVRVTFGGEALGEVVSTASPLTFDAGRLDGVVGLGPARLSISGDLAAEAPTARLQADDLPAAIAARLLPQIAPEGDFDADIVYRGGERAEIEARLTAVGVQAVGRPDLPFDGRIAVDARLPDRVSVEADLTASRNQDRAFDMRARGDLDRAPGAPWSAARLDGSVAVDGEAAFLASFALEPGRALIGRVTGEVSVAGDLGAPAVDGSVRLSDARFDDAATGLRLRDAAARLDFDGDAVGAELIASDGGEGRLSFEGRFARAGAEAQDTGAPVVGEGTLSLRNLHVVRQDFADVRASGELVLTADANAPPRLDGAIDLDRAEIDPLRLPAARDADIPQLTIDKVRGEDGMMSAGPGSGPGSSVALDVTVKAPQRIFIRSRSIESEWRLDVTFAQDPGGALTATG